LVKDQPTQLISIANMSKITPKNLHYDNSLPPFLARLQANNASQDGRHEYHAARPKKARNAEDEAEDEPVYFDEGTGESLTKNEWEAKEAAVEADAAREKGSGAKLGAQLEEETKENKEKLAAIGSSKKRKAGKVVGGEDEEVAKEPEKEPTSKPEGKKVEKGKSAKKGKKIKLSFGDDE
jgi:Domain of unknown function (DUF4604)